MNPQGVWQECLLTRPRLHLKMKFSPREKSHSLFDSQGDLLSNTLSVLQTFNQQNPAINKKSDLSLLPRATYLYLLGCYKNSSTDFLRIWAKPVRETLRGAIGGRWTSKQICPFTQYYGWLVTLSLWALKLTISDPRSVPGNDQRKVQLLMLDSRWTPKLHASSAT